MSTAVAATSTAGVTRYSAQLVATELAAATVDNTTYHQEVVEMSRRNVVLMLVVTLVAVAAGFVSVRSRGSQDLYKPRTITYRVTYYDEADKQAGTSILLRRVLSDGTWYHMTVTPDGRVVKTSGKLRSPLTGRATRADSPALLNYSYVVEKNRETETWISPDLQDYLKFTAYREDRTRLSTMEAIDVAVP